MSQNSAVIAEHLHQLTSVYIRKLPSLISDIETNYTYLANGHLEYYSEFRRKIHTLIGSSGTYGFHDVSKIARNLETFLISAEESHREIDELTLNKIRGHVISIKSLIQRNISDNRKKIPVEYNTLKNLNINPLNILVASDDDDVKIKLKFDLESESHHCFLASDGIEAIDSFFFNEIDLIIIDIYMPLMDGYKTVSRLSNIESDKHVPIIFLTSSNQRDELVKCIECGGDDFVSKPYDASLLNAKIYALDRLSKKVRQKLEVKRH